MPPSSDLLQDPNRLATLHNLSVLDTPADKGLDHLAELVRGLLEVPVALVTLVDRDRQFFKSCLGLPEPWQTRRQTPLSHSFCQHTIHRDDVLAINDARSHPLVSDNLAIADLNVVAYLGIPLVTHDDQAVGSLCAIDHEPRDWSGGDVALLRTLASAVIQRLELMARVSELEEARRELGRTETYFRSLIERGMGAVTVMDREGTILYTSPNGEEILGMSPAEREGQSAFQWVHPDDISVAGRSFQALLAEPEGTAFAEFRYRHPAKGWICIEGVGTNLLDEPAVGGIVFNFRDVTRERELEEELAQRLRLDTIGELTAGIAHDFNNLLAVVTANAELIRDGLRPDAPDAVRDLEDLQVAARGGAELIRSLMTFSRRSEPNLRPVDLAGVVTQAVRMLRRILPSRIQVEADVDTGLPPARADSRVLEQIILNLATNARDAMPRGGTLRIRLTSEELTPQDLPAHHDVQSVRGAPDPADGSDPEVFLRLEISDTGIGMDQETLNEAFQPFFSTKPEGQGTGLGLAMVRRIVQQVHGWITVESGLGEGTTFVLHLPVAKGDAEEVLPAPAADGEQMQTGGLVLVVEDEGALRRTATRVLERAGSRVLSAKNGRAGLEMWRQHAAEITVVLSDQDMPEMTGLELLNEVRRSGGSTPFVLTTGHTPPELRLRDEVEGELVLLPKPWRVEELNGAVRAAALRRPRPEELGTD